MARTARVKNMGEGETVYHLMSRTNNRRFMFESAELKNEMVRLLKVTATFSGVEILAYAALDNHFHVVVRVRRCTQPVDGAIVLERIRELKGKRYVDRLADRWRKLEVEGRGAEAEAERDVWRARMNDISQYMKTFKEEYTRFYKRNRAYFGSIWEGRFASTLVGPGDSLRRCLSYVFYNAVRARIVCQAKDYRWAWRVGTDPAMDVVALVRIVQIGAGKVLGSASFVRQMILTHGGKFRARLVVAHEVGRFAYSSHGWRLARQYGRAVEDAGARI